MESNIKYIKLNEQDYFKMLRLLKLYQSLLVVNNITLPEIFEEDIDDVEYVNNSEKEVCCEII